MSSSVSEQLIKQLALGDLAAVDTLVAAALLSPNDPALLARAAAGAVTTRDRQLVAIAAAHLRGERDLVDALARDHLVDHPDNVLVAWIAAASNRKEELS